MTIIGRVDSVWRYPVKSMRGEALPEIFAGFSGVYGDRLFAFKSSAAPPGFPYLTGREHHEMLLYQPHFRHPEKAAKPPNLAEAMAFSPLLNPICRRCGRLGAGCRDASGRGVGDRRPRLAAATGRASRGRPFADSAALRARNDGLSADFAVLVADRPAAR